jgi:CBS domain containing-hemolysin-like protein
MTYLAIGFGLLFLSLAGVLRAGGASLVRTARGDAIHDAAEHIAGAAAVARLLDDRDVIVPGVNIVHSALLVTAAIPTSWALTATFDGVWTVVSLVTLGVVLVLAGDLFPRTVGRSRPRVLAYRLAPILTVSVALGSRAADIMYDEDEEPEDDQSEQDVGEVELITSVLEFTDTIVREVMVPRPDMVTVEAAAPLASLLAVFEEHGFSRIPAVGEGIDDVVGVVIVKDLLPRLAGNTPPDTVAEVMRAIDFVPETKRVFELLREMQASKSHMAVVVDEYGGTAGLVTIEDLLEELVGEIVDEYDEDELLVERREDGTWLVDGRMAVSDLAEMIGSELPSDEWDTVGGLVLGLAGRVPIEGERYEVEDVVVEVTRVQGRRVAETVVRRLEFEPSWEESV